ncbi:response regulator transcription factor [Candidatus Roizmanbacteria bacterium]|nr:response regulator transcription factor [Candidatus Roizmanbacteria bacterium]
MAPTILIIEDEKPLLEFLQGFLQEEGYIVETVTDGGNGLNSISRRKPDLVLLDLGLPDVNGETVLETIKKDYPQLRVIILTAKAGAENIIKGLNLGADDYLEKPFDAEILLARIKARLRRTTESEQEVRIRDLVINLQTREVWRNKNTVVLTKTEFDLLWYLIKNRNRVLTRDMILNHVWGYTTDVESRVVDVYIGYLRKKIDYEAPVPLIQNKRGIGYFIKDPIDTV